MHALKKTSKLGLDIVILGSLLAGCAGTPASPTVTPAAAASSTHTATPRPANTPTATATIVPPMPEVQEITIGSHYSYFPGTIDHDQATVEVVDLSEYREKILVIETDTDGYKIRLGIYRGEVDLARWWGDSAPFVLETDFVVDASARVLVAPSDSFYSIVYISRPVALDTPEYLPITRRFLVREQRVPMDWSQTFITEYWTFPDAILNQLVDPLQFNENMNRAYAAMKDLLGRDSALLDEGGHIRLIVQDIPACGWAGNPIQMDPVCMGADLLNSGNPGWGAVHELGHDFTMGGDSFVWEEEDSGEGWANFMAFYCYENEIFINSEYDSAFWDDVWVTSAKPTDIFQGMIARLADEYGWEVARTFFRKYLAADPAREQSNAEKQRLAIRYLAEAALEVSGDQAAYDEVVDALAARGLPRP